MFLDFQHFPSNLTSANSILDLFFVFPLFHLFYFVEVELPPNLPPARTVEVSGTHAHTHDVFCGLCLAAQAVFAVALGVVVAGVEGR